VFVILIVGLALMGVATTLFLRAVAMPRFRTTAMLDQIGAYGFESRSEEVRRSPVMARIDAIASSVGGAAARRLGVSEEEMRSQLIAAGMYHTKPRNFMGYRVLSTVIAPAVWLWLASTIAYPTPVVVLGLVGSVALGWLGPMRYVQRRAAARLSKVDYDLPELIDLLVVTVESGLGLGGSLQLAADRLVGPLGDELRLVLQEQTMGLTTTEALRNMLARCDTPLMHSFVRTIVQGELLGVSIGQIMRDIAADMRVRRRQAAEERAQKAPTKILFPLVFLIFPAMFVVLLAPAIYSFMSAFGG